MGQICLPPVPPLRRAEALAGEILGEITPLCKELQRFKRLPPQRVVNTLLDWLIL